MNNRELPTVFIIDDDASVRQSIQDLVESMGLNARAFASAQEFLSYERGDATSCLVLDVRLPDMSGLDLQRKLRNDVFGIPIIFITGHADIPMTVEAMKAGAVEFLTKPFREQDLLDAIQRSLTRERMRQAEQRSLVELRGRYAMLTPRERDVMNLVVAGMLNKQIAAELGSSETTVKIHRGHVMQKMQANSLPDLVRIADKLTLFSRK